MAIQQSLWVVFHILFKVHPFLGKNRSNLYLGHNHFYLRFLQRIHRCWHSCHLFQWIQHYIHIDNFLLYWHTLMMSHMANSPDFRVPDSPDLQDGVPLRLSFTTKLSVDLESLHSSISSQSEVMSSVYLGLYPALHVHSYEPGVFLHIAFSQTFSFPVKAHSSISPHVTPPSLVTNPLWHSHLKLPF